MVDPSPNEYRGGTDKDMTRVFVTLLSLHTPMSSPPDDHSTGFQTVVRKRRAVLARSGAHPHAQHGHAAPRYPLTRRRQAPGSERAQPQPKRPRPPGGRWREAAPFGRSSAAAKHVKVSPAFAGAITRLARKWTQKQLATDSTDSRVWAGAITQSEQVDPEAQLDYSARSPPPPPASQTGHGRFLGGLR